MPRLTDHAYLLQRTELRKQWLDEPGRAFLLLSASEQWALHLFYLPSERLSDQTLIEHRQDISVYDTSLPQRAGRALARLRLMERRLETYRKAPKSRRRKGAPYQVRVLGEVHPEIDIDKLVKILLNYERRDDHEPSPRDAAEAKLLS